MLRPDPWREVFRLARKGRGLVSPNPLVGAVLVKKGGIVGRGYHRYFGGPHAEINAISQAKEKAKDATLYINLEPCSHFGKTPPCTKAIREARIKRVIISTLDPNPIVSGKGIKELKENGIKVEVGPFQEKAKRLNEVYFKYVEKKRPFVTLKIAQSLDGKISVSDGISKWITGKMARDFSHKLRFFSDAICVGINTVLKDDPSLDYRFPSKLLAEQALQLPKDSKKRYFKVILDSCARLPLSAKLWKGRGKVILATTKKASVERLKKIEEKGAEILILGKDKVNLKKLLEELEKIQIADIFVEGGGETIASFLKEKLADKILFFISPSLIGGRETKTSFEGNGISDLRKKITVSDLQIKRIGSDFLFEGYV